MSEKHIYQKGIQIFGTRKKFKKWLSRRHQSFGYIEPKKFIYFSYGREKIYQELIAIEHGFVA